MKLKKKSGLISAVIALSCASLVSVGFASWVISQGDSEVVQGTILVDDVSDQSHELTVDSTGVNPIAFKADAATAGKGWLTSTDTGVNLTAVYNITVTNLDSSSKITASLKSGHMDGSTFVEDSNAKIRNGVITPYKIGNTRLTITESVSGIVKEYDIAVRHKVALKDGVGPFSLSGLFEYDGETNTITMTNGDSAKMAINFTADSSYKKVNYEVDDEHIVLVGDDGTITPLKAGSTMIHVSVKDSNYTYIEFDVNITIKKRPFITDMKSFFLKVRKALGHFGAFAVVGLLGAITWYLWLRGKKWFPVGVFANFALGFGLSWLTEDIQKYVPGRCGLWSDVWLDFAGFSLLAGITTLTIVIVWLTRVIIGFVKKKKASQQIDEQNNEN